MVTFGTPGKFGGVGVAGGVAVGAGDEQLKTLPEMLTTGGGVGVGVGVAPGIMVKLAVSVALEKAVMPPLTVVSASCPLTPWV